MAGLVERLEKAIVKLHRKRIAGRVFALSGGTVRRGPFQGMQLVRGSHLSRSDMAMKAFGLYEPEVLEHLVHVGTVDTLVNLGAGDGYYSVGMVRAGMARRALSFELNPLGRKTILANAKLNGVSGAISVFGAADRELKSRLAAAEADPASLLVLCDIEGAEFDLLDRELMAWAARAHFVIEVHPFMHAGGEGALAKMMADFSATHNVNILKAGPSRWQGVPEIEALSDLERALVTNEGRKELGRWLVATPR